MFPKPLRRWHIIDTMKVTFETGQTSPGEGGKFRKRNTRGRLSGHFLGAYAEGGTYDFQLKKEKGYRGKYYAAAGITYGYVRPLARHLAIEFSVGIGYLDTEYRKYTSYGNDLVWVSSGKYHFIGPTKAKISLVWLLTSGR